MCVSSWRLPPTHLQNGLAMDSLAPSALVDALGAAARVRLPATGRRSDVGLRRLAASPAPNIVEVQYTVRSGSSRSGRTENDRPGPARGRPFAHPQLAPELSTGSSQVAHFAEAVSTYLASAGDPSYPRTIMYSRSGFSSTTSTVSALVSRYGANE